MRLGTKTRHKAPPDSLLTSILDHFGHNLVGLCDHFGWIFAKIFKLIGSIFSQLSAGSVGGAAPHQTPPRA